MTQLIYSTEKVHSAEGRLIKNPRHFLAPVDGVTKVYIAGDWPKVRRAYEAAGVSVSPIEDMRALPGKAKVSEPRPDKPGGGIDPHQA